MKHGLLRAFLVALAVLGVIAAPGCVRRSKVVPGGGPTPLPTSIPFVLGACLTPQSAARHTSAATPSPMPSISPAPFTIDSSPQGLAVTVDGASAGNTPVSESPAFSNSLHVITIANGAGGSDYSVSCAQDANASTTVFYNRAADTAGAVTSLSRLSSSHAAQANITAQNAVRRMPKAYAHHTAPDLVEVQYRASAIAAEHRSVAEIEHAAGAIVGRTISPAGAPVTARVLRVDGAKRNTVIAALRKRSDVLSAEPAQQRYLKTTTPITPPNDPHFSQTQQWDMYQIGMLNAWAYTPGFGASSVQLAVIDSGLDTQSANTMAQADLVSKVTHAESVINGVITQGNAAVQDEDGHGTNVAGIALATANNNAGFAGVAGGASLQVYRIFQEVGGQPTTTTADEAQAIYDAISNGTKVINLSLGSCPGDGPDAVEKTAIDFAITSGVFVAAAAGNERSDPLCAGNTEMSQSLDFPAAYDGVMAVGASAIKNDDGTSPSSGTEYVASYSNSGPGLGVVAPGGDPSSTSDPDLLHWISNHYSTTGNPPCSTPSNCFALIAGTSQATPHVAGAAALLLSANSALTPAQLYQVINSTADDLHDPNQGHGRLNVYRAMALVTGDPSPPSYTPGKTQLIAFAYTNSGAIDATPAIADVTFRGGIPVNDDGTFRIADIPGSVTNYKIGVWYDANADAKVDAGDRFGASGPCVPTAACTSAGSISVTPVTGAGFALP